MGFGLLVILLTTSGMVSYWQIQRIDADLIRIVDIEEPLEQAVLEMEIHAGETARAVLHHIHQPDEIFRRRAAAAEGRLTQYAAVFDNLAETERQRRLGQRVGELYAEFKQLGDEIMDLADQRRADVLQLREDVVDIDMLLEEMLATQSDQAVAKLEAALRMQIAIEQAFSVVEAYQTMAGPEMRIELESAIGNFRQYAATFRAARTSSENVDRFDHLEERYNHAANAARVALNLTDKINRLTERFESDLEDMDRCLDQEIQPLIQRQTHMAAHDALQSSRQAVLTQIGLSLLGMIFGGAIGWCVSRGVIVPVNALVDGATIIGNGERDHRIVLETNDEFGKLASAFNGMVDNLNNSADELLATQQREEQLRLEAAQREIEQHAAAAKTDALTQLSNRRAFDERLEAAAGEFAKHGIDVSIALFDVDRFKLFNDTYGHQAGDEVLRGVAHTLESHFDEPDFVARFGGEEFAVIMPGASPQLAADKADCARQAIQAAEVVFEGQRFHVTASGGVAALTADESLASLIRRADESLYAAKDAGRNNVQWHDGKQIAALPDPLAAE